RLRVDLLSGLFDSRIFFSRSHRVTSPIACEFARERSAKSTSCCGSALVCSGRLNAAKAVSVSVLLPVLPLPPFLPSALPASRSQFAYNRRVQGAPMKKAIQYSVLSGAVLAGAWALTSTPVAGQTKAPMGPPLVVTALGGTKADPKFA